MSDRDSVQSPESVRARRTRAAAARSNARATKLWALEAKAAVAGSLWRVSSVWVEESSQMLCAEFVHASSGKSRFLKLEPGNDRNADERKGAILQQLS